MCIAIIKNAEARIPKKKDLKVCWTRNPDGAGIAVWQEAEQVWDVTKGLMSWNKFWKSIREYNLHRQENRDIAFIHFRYATSGKDGAPGGTHPFPVTGEDDLLMDTNYQTPSIVMHNGVVGAGKGDLSDTQVWVKTYIDPIYHLLGTDPRIEQLIGNVCDVTSNRWAITKGKDIYLWGKWLDHGRGCKLSKILPKEYVPKKDSGPWYNGEESSAYGWGAPGYTGGYGDTSAATSTCDRGGTIRNLGQAPTLNVKDEIFDINMGDYASAYQDMQGNWDWSIWKGEREPYDRGDTTVNIYDADGKVIGMVDKETGESTWEGEPPVDEDFVTPDSRDVASTLQRDETEAEVVTCPHCESQFVMFESDNGKCAWCKKDVFQSQIDSYMSRVGVKQADRRDCPECGNPVTLASMTHRGECPWCMTVMPSEFDDAPDFQCPSCGEKHHLAESEWKGGDTDCHRCGAVFTDDTREVVLWNLSTAKKFKESQEALYESH
jgi:DNA-directed RNA polymerase subunit RPC12/RpoP